QQQKKFPCTCCGNFAVLVDVHILPQGSSKDTSWFSDHEKEEVCMLLEEVVASRVKHYLEAPKQRGQWKSTEHATSGPLFLTGKINYLTYYDIQGVFSTFRKRVALVVFQSLQEGWIEAAKILFKFKTEIPFYCSVKRTKRRRRSPSKPQIRKVSKKVYLGSVDSQTGNRKNDCQTSLGPPSEVKCRSRGLLKDCTNTAESNLELPVLEPENYVNQRQPDDVSSQQKPHSVEWLKLSLLSENPPCSSESALLGPKQSQRVTKTQAQQKSCGAGEKLEHFKKVSSEETPLIPSNTEMSKSDGDCLGPFLEEKTPLNSGLFSKQDMTKTASDEESLTLGKNLSRPLSVRNNIVQTSQNEPSTTPEELSVMPSSCLELQPLSSEKLIQKRKKEVENGLGRLKLRRLKKS
uniref:SLX4 interacting protein n=1 Tax=Bubo bubo TaxID=30461 RepID=A0A8C0EGI8_BUBBB